MTTAVLVPPVPGAVPAFDFSSNNEDDKHRIDWYAFAAWVLALFPEAIVIIKMSQGDWYVNPYRHRQRWGAHAAGFLNVLLYHYIEVVASGGPNIGKGLSGAQNADFFIKVQGDDGGLVKGEGYAGDWEDNTLPTADLGAMAWDFGQRVALGETLPGLRPLLYSGEWFANAHGLERDQRLARFLLWWAAYGNQMPTVPEPWASAGKGIALWQFTDRGQFPGLPWTVDVSWWLAGLPALRSIQMGYQPDPLAGNPVNTTPPDVPVAINSQSATDAEAIALKIAADSGALAAQLAGSQQQAAQTIQADADRLALVLKEG